MAEVRRPAFRATSPMVISWSNFEYPLDLNCTSTARVCYINSGERCNMQFDTTENGCCTSDNDRNACSLPTNGQLPSCNCASQANKVKSAVLLEQAFSIEETRSVIQRNQASLKLAHDPPAHRDKGRFQRNMRGGVMLGIACLTSPCCTPLLVPAVLGLLAGTPAALWLTLYIGWVYGGLTLLSFMSLVLGLRWVWQKLSPAEPSPAMVQRPKLSDNTRDYSVASGISDGKIHATTRN